MADLPTSDEVLACPMQPNGAGADTIRGYLGALLMRLWEFGEDFGSKRPFGNSGWQYELYEALARQDYITGTFDEDGYLDDVDTAIGDRLIKQAITHLYLEAAAG